VDQQHTLIKGYRDLSQSEIDAMNKIKALAEEVGTLVRSFDGPVKGTNGEGAFFPDARWRAIAETQLQQGFMSLTRCIAQPTTF
jgi:hypothetical protein